MRRIINKVRYKWFNFKSRCQRFKRGYADEDVWNMDDWFIRTVGPMLLQLANGASYPCTITHEKWEEILMDMYWSLWHMDEENVMFELKSEFQNDYKLISEIQKENKEHFFELFNEWFFDLWD